MKTILTSMGLTLASVAIAQAGPTPDQGRLLATAGVSQIEGQAGGGLTPWATIAGYGSPNSWGGTVHATHVKLSDFTATSTGFAVGIGNRVEVSYTDMQFDTEALGAALGLGAGFTFDQDVISAKVRIAGDLVADQDSWMPQISVSLQHKQNRDGDVVALIGATDDQSTDYLISATKLFLAKSLLVNVTARSTTAHQFGFLGFGDERTIQAEASAAVLLSRRLALGAEYRTKPDELAFAGEDDAYDVFGAFFLNKHLSVTAAHVNLGSIAGADDQSGTYLSLQGSF